MLTRDEAREISMKPAVMDTLRAVSEGVVISLNPAQNCAYLEEVRGRRVRDPEFPERKLLVAGGMTLFWAGYLDQFGVLTAAGRAALAAEKD